MRAIFLFSNFWLQWK